MDMGFSEEQEMLQKFARDFMTDKCPKEYVREMEADEKGYAPEIWQGMAELGWLGLAFHEDYEGGGMSFFDLTVLLEEMGRACLPGPFFSTVVLGGLTILDVGSEEQKKELLPQIADGKTIITMALTEPGGGYTPVGICTKATPDGDDYVINGTKLFVTDAQVCDKIICVARINDGTSEDGITLFIVDADSQGIEITPLKTIAGDKQAEVVFNNVRVSKNSILGEVGKGWKEVVNVINRSAVAKCAEMAGGAKQVLEISIEYAKERVQFGVPIGSFQIIQHYCSDMATDVDGIRLITQQAAWLLSEEMPSADQVAAAKAFSCEAYRRVVGLGQQIHGSLGLTSDHDMQLYYRRAKAGELAFGDAAFHREKLAVELGL